MEPFSRSYPKPLLPVLGEPLIELQLRHLAAAGIEDVLVVVGHRGEAIVDAVGDGSKLGVRVSYVVQPEPLGIAHALACVEPHVHGPLLALLGDIHLVPRDLGGLLSGLRERTLQGVLAVVPDADDAAIARNFAAVLGPDGLVARVIEKPRHPPSRLKGCGVYGFDVQIFDALRRTPRTSLRNEYELTDAIQVFIDDGCRVGVSEALASDRNLTEPRDLWLCNMSELDRQGLARVIAAGARVDPGARVERSVIGPRAVIEAGAVVRDAVVFADTRVSADLTCAIATPETVVQCG
jgi:dTDP-glucose pyrophosphorylase